jgi:hypothetical protein
MKPARNISLQTKLQRNPNMVISKIDDEVVMMSIENGEYYGLDEIGSCIWGRIEKPIVVEELIQNLMDEFDVDRSDCQNDTIEFLNDLYSKGLLIVLSA